MVSKTSGVVVPKKQGEVSMSTCEAPPIYAYFFPQDETDPGRIVRSQKYNFPLHNEYKIVQQVTPLIAEPVTYCLGDSRMTVWRDSDPMAVRRQVELAQSHGIDGFIVDSYEGAIQEKPVTELGRILDLLARPENRIFSFGSMYCLKLSRNHLPVPADKRYSEPGRWLDCSPHTAQLIIDKAATLWNAPNYLHVDAKPYLSVYGLLGYPGKTISQRNNFVHFLREYAKKKYQTDLFLVGVACSPADFYELAAGYDFDQTTNYAGLVDFNPVVVFPGEEVDPQQSAPPLQSHEEQINRQFNRCSIMEQLGLRNFIPAAVVGYNGSYRGLSNVTLETVIDLFPYTPILTGSTPKLLSSYLQRINDYLVEKNVPTSQRMISFFSWNEVGEGGAVLPRLGSDGTVDYSWLNAIKDFSQILK
jgi:hypothetical protein